MDNGSRPVQPDAQSLGPARRSLWIANMDWAKPEYSRSQINRAARTMLKGEPNVFDPLAEFAAYYDSIEMVDNWRSSHNYPLNTFKVTLRKKAAAVDGSALVAQRIKRMSSIEAKLTRYPTMQVCQMQDLGGCRAILNSVKSVRELMQRYERSDLKHALDDVDDYLAKPKASGYRGIHMIWKYQSDKEAPSVYNGLFIEMQLRTRRQHAWATAVETVGTLLRQSLKASQGEDRWLRFFSLMGSVIARSEGSRNLVPDTPLRKAELLSDVREAVAQLNVEGTLNFYRQALNIATEGTLKGYHYYLLRLEPLANRMTVTGFARKNLEEASRKYTEAEKEIAGKPGAEAVLVSVDSMANLRRAYPNYFLDTEAFLAEVKNAVRR